MTQAFFVLFSFFAALLGYFVLEIYLYFSLSFSASLIVTSCLSSFITDEDFWYRHISYRVIDIE